MEYDPKALDCWFRIVESYREASWIQAMHQYPDGGAYGEQTQTDLLLWELAINAQNEAVMKRGDSGR